MTDKHYEAGFPPSIRNSEIAQVLTYIKDGKSCQIIGIPGVSRSTLLGMLAYNLSVRQEHLGDQKESFHFIKVDFSEIRNKNLFDAMKYLFLNLTESLRERGWKEQHRVVGDTFREHLQFKDELVLFQGFKEAIDYLALEQEITTVFLFDRFDDYIPVVVPEFFANMRILRNRAKYRFSIVFSVQRPLEDLLEPSLFADYYEFTAGNIVYLSVSDKKLTQFRLDYSEKITGKTIAERDMDRVMHLTGGHGKITKLAVEALLGKGSVPKELDDFLLNQKTILRALEEIWNALLPAEQALLLEEVFADDTCKYLVDVGLVSGKDITIPLFRTYIHKQNVKKSRQQLLAYDQNTNTITKGAMVVSDKLTSSEFRLLRFLLQQPNTIVERDALINVVWKDVKSTAGITDQAVDQLIFRVRRKIEDDPNMPKHLLTIKGRGVKLEI